MTRAQREVVRRRTAHTLTTRESHMTGCGRQDYSTPRHTICHNSTKRCITHCMHGTDVPLFYHRGPERRATRQLHVSWFPLWGCSSLWPFLRSGARYVRPSLFTIPLEYTATHVQPHSSLTYYPQRIHLNLRGNQRPSFMSRAIQHNHTLHSWILAAKSV